MDAVALSQASAEVRRDRQSDGGLDLEQIEKALALEAQHFAACLGADRRRPRLIPQQCELAEHVARCERRNAPQVATRRIPGEDAVRAADHDVQAVSGIALAADAVVDLEGEGLNAGRQPRQSDAVELREQRDAGQ